MNNWTYMLRIMRRNPESIPMGRLGEYIRQFAELLGAENQPVFKGIKKASTGLKATVPPARQQYAKLRLVEAKTDASSRSARALKAIEEMLGDDAIGEAQLLDSNDKVVYLFHGNANAISKAEKLTQQGLVDGIVTGLQGADNTMHLYIRDHFDRDLKLIVRNEELARELLLRFRRGIVRLQVHGTWQRTEAGWIPEASKCFVDSFDILDDTPLHEVFADLASIPDNGWQALEDPMAAWKSLRGLH